ncbi:hypothetical protein BHE74_00042817 [Ensete ventricosum]|uniref:Uncharacterized protein n=1 Tax=Ensete ventricosum TaxID=4639 RepID=A0A444G485_ENSVE|nr:hypothetical protein B296_00020228 [Ensete ventricosum]RWW29683.1 hypothetical protein GW17_00005777 [Ensete ventricosum]RWW50885.1 hypothetical protein BHE74_00042817 [Ensete ventricosum]RZR83677.1 hypothetical protein BHM03_00010359 [Ensete ventricosum]
MPTREGRTQPSSGAHQVRYVLQRGGSTVVAHYRKSDGDSGRGWRSREPGAGKPITVRRGRGLGVGEGHVRLSCLA